MTQPNKTSTAPKKTTKQHIFAPLSMELAGIPEDEQCKIFEQFETAIKKGTFLAVQDRDQKFTATYFGLDGQHVEESRPEEHIEISEHWTKWLAEQRVASRHHVMKLRRDFTITSEVLHRSPEEFEAIARMRRETLMLEEREHEEAKTAKQGRRKPNTPARPRRKSKSETAAETDDTDAVPVTSATDGAERVDAPDAVNAARDDTAEVALSNG